MKHHGPLPRSLISTHPLLFLSYPTLGHMHPERQPSTHLPPSHYATPHWPVPDNAGAWLARLSIYLIEQTLAAVEWVRRQRGFPSHPLI